MKDSIHQDTPSALRVVSNRPETPCLFHPFHGTPIKECFGCWSQTAVGLVAEGPKLSIGRVRIR
eukprot:2673687-Prorocentrum_lima.AAC.1